MRKFLPALFLLLLSAGMAQAQSTTVSGQVTDAAGQSWNDGAVTFTFVPNPQFPNIASYTWTGGSLQSTYSGTLSSSGAYTISIPSNTAISPIGSSWAVQVSSQATFPAFTVPTTVITGATQTLNVTPPAILIDLTNPQASPMKAYADSEIVSALLGSYYYQLPIQNYRYCQAVTGQLCTLWNTFGGGSPPTGLPRWDQLINPNANSAPDFDGTTFSFTGGTWDWGTMNLILPRSSLFLPTLVGQIGFDTLNGNLLFNNAVSSIVAMVPQSASINNGDLASFSLNMGQVTLAPIPANDPSGGSTVLVVNNTNTRLGDTYCVTGLGPPLVADNCTPGVPVNVQTTDYTVDPIPDRGTAVISNDNTNNTISFAQQISDSTDMDASWFFFTANKNNTGATGLSLTAPSVFDSTGTQSETLLTGQQCSMFTDQTSPGTAYPKCHEPRIQAGNGISLLRSPYFLTVSATPASASTGNGIISGCGVSWTSGLTFEVSACTYSIGGSTFSTAETSVTLSAADPTNPRIDVIAVNSSSAVQTITGTPAANPAQPSVDPTTQLELTFVTIPAASTTPVVSQTVIYRNNAGSPTEFNCTSTANLNCNSTNNPFSGTTHSIEATTAVTTNSATLTVGTGTVNLANSDTFVFFIRNKASWAAAKSVQIFWRNGSTNVGTSITFKNGVYGFDQTNTTTYQQIAIPVTAFQTGVAPVTNVRFQVLGGGGSIGFYLGNILLQKGFTGGGGSGGGGSFQLQVNASPCQSPCSLTDTASVTWAHTLVGGVDQVSATATSSGGITSINAATGPAITVAGTGSTNVTTSGNTITVSGVNGTPSPQVNVISNSSPFSGLSYTITNADNAARDVFTATGGAIAVSLPQAGQISSAAFVANRITAGLSGCTNCTSSTFSQSAGNALFVSIAGEFTPTVNSVTDTAGDSFALLRPAILNYNGFNDNLYVFVAYGISASGSNAVTVHLSGSTTIQVQVNEYTTLTVDHAVSAGPSNPPPPSATVAVSNPNAIAIAFEGKGANVVGCPTGWIQRSSTSSQNTCERLLSSVSSATFTSGVLDANNSVINLASYGVSGITTFGTGWYVTLENSSPSLVTVTPTTSTINGQTTLVIAPNQFCAVMSDGANYNSICGSIPNLQTNGVMGQPIEVAGVNTSAAGADQSITTLITTGAVDAMYEVKGSIACHGTTSTGTSTLTITYTDTSNTVQTLSSAPAACTTLGAASVSQVNPIFRAKASTNIRYAFAHGGTQPTVDVSVAVYQLSTK